MDNGLFGVFYFHLELGKLIRSRVWILSFFLSWFVRVKV